MRKLAVAVALLLVTGDASAKKSSIQTGDPLPKKPLVNKQCHDQGALRLIGSDPSTPFATIKKGAIASAGRACCAQWARKGSKYKSLDAYGQIAGDAEISGGEGYDVSQCYELTFSIKKGKPGVGLYVGSDYVAPKSAVWLPSDAEKVALAKVVGSLEQTMVPSADYPCTPQKTLPLSERALYFHGNGARYAVVGGAMLIVARLQDDGRWIAHHTDNHGASTCMARTFMPRAVFDLNGDGRPELFFHEDFGDSFGDVALEQDGTRWVRVAEAVGGSTA